MTEQEGRRRDVIIMAAGHAENTIDSKNINEDPPEYFKEYLLRADFEFKRFGKIGGDLSSVTGGNVRGVVRKRITENDPHVAGDGDFVTAWNERQEHTDKHNIIRKIISRETGEIIDSELARAYFDDEIAELEEKRLRLVEENERFESDPEVESSQELFLKIADLAEEANQKIESMRSQEGLPDEETLLSLERVLSHLQRAQMESKYDKASRAIGKNQEEIQKIASKLLKFEKLRDNIEVSGKEARGIEEVKERLKKMPDIIFNEDHGQLLAKKRTDYEGRVVEDRKDIYGLDSKLKHEILSRLFKGEEVNLSDLAEEMELKTLRDFEGLERAAKVIKDYTETGGQNVEQQ